MTGDDRGPDQGRLAPVRRGGRRAPRARAARHLARHHARRTAVPDRAERLRQEHAAQHDRRAAGADHRHGRGRRQAGARAAAARHRLRVPGERAVSLEHGDRERQARHGVPGRAARPSRRRARASRWRRSGSRTSCNHYPAQLSGGMRQRAALARALSLRNRHAADGRAVRRARRADPHDPRRGPFGAAVTHRQDHRVRHPLARAKRCSWPTAWRCSRRGPAPSRKSSAWTSRIRASRSSSPRKSSAALRNTLYGLLHDEIRKARGAIGVRRAAAEP